MGREGGGKLLDTQGRRTLLQYFQVKLYRVKVKEAVTITLSSQILIPRKFEYE